MPDKNFVEEYVIVKDSNGDASFDSFLLTEELDDLRLRIGKELYKLFPIRRRIATNLVIDIDNLLYKYSKWIPDIVENFARSKDPEFHFQNHFILAKFDDGEVEYIDNQDIFNSLTQIRVKISKKNNKNATWILSDINDLINYYGEWMIDRYLAGK